VATLNKGQKRGRFLLWTSLGIIGVLILMFSDLGLLRLFRLRHERVQLQSNIQNMKEQIFAFEQERARLDSDMVYIERLSRERFKMVRPGEKIIIVHNNRQIKN